MSEISIPTSVVFSQEEIEQQNDAEEMKDDELALSDAPQESEIKFNIKTLRSSSRTRNRRTAQFGGNDASQNSIKTQDLLKAMDEESKVSHKLKDSQEEDKEVIPNLHYNAEKAGMASIDKETIQKKIIEASKGSSYYKKKQERTEKAKAKAKEWKKEIRKLKSNRSYWSKVTKQLNNKANDMRSKRDLSRTWIHVDMDMFYAAVAIHDNPSLKDIPIAVGGMQMISTAIENIYLYNLFVYS